MRVISGEARGRKLLEPKGMEIRPTTDKVKESVFNIVQFDVEGRRVLDLFAGTGQLGIEALSRGAASAVFVDASPEAIALVRENLSRTGLGANAEIYQTDAIAFAGSCGRKFDLAFLDPPYRKGLLQKALNALIAADALRPNGLILCECGDDEELPEAEGPYELKKCYRYGKIRLMLLQRAAD